MKKIPKKNYLILLIIFTSTILLSLYLGYDYKKMVDTNRLVPVLKGLVPEIYKEELEHFSLENPDAVLYICAADDNKCRSFENKLKSELKDLNIRNLVYLNIIGQDKKEFANYFNNIFKQKKKLKGEYPTFVIIENSKIKSILENEKLKVKELKSFLNHNNIGE